MAGGWSPGLGMAVRGLEVSFGVGELLFGDSDDITPNPLKWKGLVCVTLALYYMYRLYTWSS